MTKHRYSKIAVAEDESAAKLREEFPKELVTVYIKLVNSDFSDKEYTKYSKLAEDFLAAKYKDTTEQCKLIVRLAKATLDLVDKYNEKKQKKKTRKSKKDKGLACSECPLPQSGANEGREEGSKQEEVPGETNQ